MTATAIGHLVRAGLLAHLGADTTTPDVHPEQFAALARRRDLPALLDRHVPLGPDRAARRLGVRRTEWDQIVRLGWITPIGMVTVDYKRARAGPRTSRCTPAGTSPCYPSHARRWTGGPCAPSPRAATPRSPYSTPSAPARRGMRCSWRRSRGSRGWGGRRW
ncbi:hypothetical protein ACIGW0_23755 [Streptomyces bikiniensis]|uniref:Winged helix-turn-helix domain-containing protein n=1 Tax=Streptomyces bikiniensis TaxID=1896 RepID=A0ABW8D167_STRBI